MRYSFERARSDEDRCIKSDCPYAKVDGADYCPRHGANKQLEKRAREMQYQFKKDEIRRRVDLLAADPQRYRLDEELAILRLTLEQTINTITTESDREYALFQASDTIKNLVSTIEKTAQTCVTQSVNLGLLMTAEDVQRQVQQVIDVVAEEVQDEETLLRIASKLDRIFGGGGSEVEGDAHPIQLGYAESTD